jgi:2-oxoglutarate dehydrogenase E2 component (dihydrolipoamide succinyltransferase)
MAQIEVALPAMGEGIIEATITKWLVSEGTMVEEDQPLIEVATDKVDSEIPSPVRGILSKILVNEGETPQVGDILAIIETDSPTGSGAGDQASGKSEPVSDPSPAPSGKTGDMTADAGGIDDRSPGHVQEMPRQTSSGKFLTPLVRSIAREEKVSSEELESIKGSGEGGRINKNDILDYLKYRDTGSGESQGNIISTVEETGDGDRIIPMDRVRKLIASHMISSKQTSAHVTSFIDTDVTELVRWREAGKGEFRERENLNLTYTPLIVEASARALRDYPMINISVDGSDIIVKKNINIGVAVALPDYKLIVPVIKNADEKSLYGLVRALNDLASRARLNKLLPNEITGGTFTITNFGTYRNTSGTPIINQPEVAILGVGAIIKKPVVMETIQGDVIAIRNIMTLSLSYDHRVIDGALGGKFLYRISEYLENFDTGRKI